MSGRLKRIGIPLGGAPVSADFRGLRQADALEGALGRDRIYAPTGQPPSAIYSLPKMIWWRDRAPDIYARIWKFLCFGDFVAMRLGFEPMIDPSMAARTLVFDIHQRAWSEEMLAAAGIPPEKLPRVAASGTVLGAVPAPAAEALGPTGEAAVVVRASTPRDYIVLFRVGGQDDDGHAGGAGAVVL